jgi:hypothetical protein
MSKHPRYNYKPEDLFLHVYVLVDDWLQENEARYKLPKQANQVASYSELLSIALVGELMAQGFESVWYWLVKDGFAELYPALPDASRYQRVLVNAEVLWAELAQYIAQQLPSTCVKAIDAKPLPVAKGKRAERCKCLQAAKGFSTMGMLHGFKLHALVNMHGLFERWSFVPADTHETRPAPELIETSKATVIGDKAYLGVQGIITPKRKNMTRDTGWNKTFNRLRKRIETAFSCLVRSFNLHTAQVKTFRSLRAKVNLKIAAYNLTHSAILTGL